MEDRVVAGGLAGLIASIVHEGYAMLMKALNYSDRCYGDLAFNLVTRTSNEGIASLLVGLFSNMAIGMFFGIIFAYVIKYSSSKYLLIKGFSYGWILWMFLSGFGASSGLPRFDSIPPNVSLVTLVGSILYGVVMAYLLGILEKKTKLV